MSAEFWAIIGVGVGVTTIVGTLFTILNMRISDLRKDMRDMAEDLSGRIVRSEEQMNHRMDSLENNLGELREDIRQIEIRLETKIDGVEARLGARIDSVEATVTSIETELGSRIDGLDTRLRVVEQGQARIIGAVEMMQTIVVATLRGEQEEVGAD